MNNQMNSLNISPYKAHDINDSIRAKKHKRIKTEIP